MTNASTNLEVNPSDNVLMLNAEETIEYLKSVGVKSVTMHWLRRMRMKENKGQGIKFTKVANRPLYTKKSIHEYLNKTEG